MKVFRKFIGLCVNDELTCVSPFQGPGIQTGFCLEYSLDCVNDELTCVSAFQGPGIQTGFCLEHSLDCLLMMS